MTLVFRKLYRLCGLIFPLIYLFNNKPTTIFWLAPVFLLFLILEIFRFFFPELNRRLFKNFSAILKQEESQGKVLGATYFLFACLLTVIFFEKTVAITSLLFLIFGDAVSALVGVRWGRIKIGKKSLEGSLGFLLSCFIVAVILKYYIGLDLRVAFWGAVAATLAELAPIPVNDNLTISLCAALAMVLVS